MAQRKFDEVNSRYTSHEEYVEYFSAMELTDREIERRVETAEDFEKEFLLILALALLLHQEGRFDMNRIRQRFYDAYMEVGGRRIPDTQYLKDRAAFFAEKVSETTREHIDSDYYTSDDRAVSMSETESNVVNGYADFLEAEENGYTRKQWRTMRDKRVRDSHRAMEGKTVGLWEPFNVNGYFMMFPCDTETDSPPPEEISNCRCAVRYLR